MVEQDIEFITFDGESITKSDYRNEIIDMYIRARYDGLTKITDFTVGSEAYHLADIMASLMLEHRVDIDSNYRMSMIHYCSGEFLDAEGDKCGVHRRYASPSRGEVIFSLKEAKDTQIIIPKDTVVATDDAISFVLLSDLQIEAGEISASGEVLCELEGEYTNVLPNTVTIIVSDLTISGISVNNPEQFYDGEDIEEDDEFRARILQAPSNFPTGTLKWFENTAMNDETVRTSVHDVVVRKNVSGYSENIIMYYKPLKEEDTVIYNGETVPKAYKDLTELFEMPEYNVVGITMKFIKGSPITVLPAQEDNVQYLFAIIPSEDYLLDDNLKADIEATIIEFNDTARLGNEFNPDGLALNIEEIEGVFKCRIIKHDLLNNNYSEVTASNYSRLFSNDEYYSVDLTNIENRITGAGFTIDLTPTGE